MVPKEIFTATGPTLVTSPFPFPSPRRTSPIFPANSTTAGRSNLPEPSTSATHSDRACSTTKPWVSSPSKGAATIEGDKTFTNSGTVLKTGSGTATIGVSYFDNLSGPIIVNAGNLTLNSQGTSTATLFTVATGSEIDFTTSSAWSGILTGSGGGIVNFDLNSYNALNLDGATLNFPAGMLDWTSQALQGSFTNAGSLNLIGSNQLTVEGDFDQHRHNQ